MIEAEPAIPKIDVTIRMMDMYAACIVGTTMGNKRQDVNYMAVREL